MRAINTLGSLHCEKRRKMADESTFDVQHASLCHFLGILISDEFRIYYFKFILLKLHSQKEYYILALENNYCVGPCRYK
jgi:hypothetical protein